MLRNSVKFIVLILILLFGLSAESFAIAMEGKASWYGDAFHGKKTANGEIFNMYDYTAAHTELDFNTMVRVTNLDNGKSVVVRINDRGPFVGNRIIDLSKRAFSDIAPLDTGIITVKLEILKGNVREIDEREAEENITDEEYNIQFGAFSNKENALNYARELIIKYNIKVKVYKLIYEDDGVLYKIISDEVFVGTQAVSNAINDYKDKGLDCFLVPKGDIGGN